MLKTLAKLWRHFERRRLYSDVSRDCAILGQFMCDRTSTHVQKMTDDQLPQICDLPDKFPINEFLKMDLTQIYCIVNKNKIYSCFEYEK